MLRCGLLTALSGVGQGDFVITGALLQLTLWLPIPLRLYTLPYWSNPPFLISDILALRTERQSARMSEIKNGGLDQYGAEPFEQQQFGTAGVERVNNAQVTMASQVPNKILLYDTIDFCHLTKSGYETC